MTRFSSCFLSLAVLLCVFTHAKGAEKKPETYHILQKGYIRVEGSTNLFKFSGTSLRNSGSLYESKKGDYTGAVTLRFDQITFPIPGVQSVLKDPGYMDAERYPTIEIKLDRFNPHQKPATVDGTLDLHNVRKKVRIQIDLFDVSPIVRAEGQFTVRQTDFQVPLYQKGLLKMDDQLKISFLLFFCEIHHDTPDDDHIDSPELQSILESENITILNEPGFVGCKELKDRMPEAD